MAAMLNICPSIVSMSDRFRNPENVCPGPRDERQPPGSLGLVRSKPRVRKFGESRRQWASPSIRPG
ncbi:hypothetical protein PG985_015994 [Apiospora marii]|uniref:uncharacterized protein n=1 Tax=Apiospora marii TaxID=335849 RepID=UPI00312D9160